MSPLQFVVIFAAGAGLYYAAVVLLGGILAAVTVPVAYFDWFGPGNTELALAVLQFASFALPIALVVAAGTLAVRRLVLGSASRAVLRAILLGVIACFAYELASCVLLPPPETSAQVPAPAERVREALLPPWWAASGTLAPWLGLAFAAWWSARKRVT